jgi:hypothetical protein
MLINLSNHPSTSWQPLQLEAAAAYGEIVDLPFPVISPDWDTAKVETVAREYSDKYKQLLYDKSKQSAVHLAGEPVFCFLLAQLLLKENVICLTSTTERIVVEENSTKISEFRFGRFREYKLL